MDCDGKEAEKISRFLGAWICTGSMTKQLLEAHVEKNNSRGVPLCRMRLWSSRRGTSGHDPFRMVNYRRQKSGEVLGVIDLGNFYECPVWAVWERRGTDPGWIPVQFRWKLHPQEGSVHRAVAYTVNRGLGRMTEIFHKLYRKGTVSAGTTWRKRTVLLNSTGRNVFLFDINEEKILNLAGRPRSLESGSWWWMMVGLRKRIQIRLPLETG